MHRQAISDLIDYGIYNDNDTLYVDLEESPFSRKVGHDHNDLLRHFSAWNPAGSELEYLRRRGEDLGKSLYSELRKRDYEDLVVLSGGTVHESTERGAHEDAVYILRMLEADAEYKRAGLEAVEETSRSSLERNKLKVEEFIFK